MLSADHRVIKKMTNIPGVSNNMPGITPLLTGRTLDKNKINQQKIDMFTKNKLKSIVEEEDGKPKTSFIDF